MNGLLLLAADAATSRDLLMKVATCPMFWALLVGALGLAFIVPYRFRYGKTIGSALLVIAAGLLAADLPLLNGWLEQGTFWLLALITLAAAVCTIASKSAVYSAIWFALSLLATAGLYFYQGAEFLGVATIVVYAGAIVVTFLFVIMLAQPEGHSSYDRISWGWFPKTFSVLAAATFVGLLTMLLGNAKDQAAPTPLAHAGHAFFGQPEPKMPPRKDTADKPPDGTHHMAQVGRTLFSQHLVGVEVAGTLLLAALVGAVAIAIQGKPRLGDRIEEALQ
ncbi:MAG: NADH-quinone oxidoreductase subunit J [Pirellulaceae bacterium]|nr:NADH-quinone oxidoreductase subunit J [Pirellulaceae bacterium]